jgi:insulysin
MLAVGLLGLAGALQLRDRSDRQLEKPAVVSITKPALDRKTYAYHTLANGMRVLAVQDPDSAKAGFAVAVDAGSYSDGDDFPGLAHFCEHMLFLGNAKYPDQGDFDDFLSQHDGMSNAYTDQEMTVYFNEVGMSGFDGAMDRFAQFFISPSFNRTMANREIHAVDSEHQKNLPDAFRRTWEVMRSLANPKSRVSKFYTGDITTLLTDEKGEKVVDALHKFHDENYCARRERLVIVANMSTADILKSAETHFASVPDQKECIDHKTFDNVDAWEGHLGQMLHIGTHGTPQLWSMFALPPTEPHFRAQPDAYLSYLFSDATNVSLRAAVKEANLATGVSAWVSDTSATSMLWTVFDLTEHGEENYEQVLEHLYGFLALVRQRGVDEQVYKSLGDLAKVHFDYQDPKDSVMSQVSSLASALTQYGPDHVLTGGFLIDDPQPDVITSYLERLKPENSNVALVSPSFTTPEKEKAALEKKFPKAKVHLADEKYYQVPFVKTTIAEEMGERMTKPFEGRDKPKFAPPGALIHVPTELALTTETSGEFPKRLPSSRSELWWKGMGVHKLPKAQVRVKMSFAKDVADAELAALGMLHSSLVADALEEDVDELVSSGVSYSFMKEGDAFTLSFNGFDQHLEVLMQKVLEKVREPSVSSFIFERNRLAKIQRFEDVTSSQAYEHGSEFYSVAMDTDAYSRAEYLQFLKANTTTLARVQEVVKNALKKSRLTMLFVGNIPSERAESMATLVENAVLDGDLLPEDEEFQSSVVHPKTNTSLRMRNPIQGDTNHATVNVYQWPDIPTIAERVNLLILGSMLHRKAFDELRTSRQLGYVVSAGVVPHGPIGELKVLVQGTKADPELVDSYIEEMLTHFSADLRTMKDEEFANRKESVRIQLSKPDQTQPAEASRYWHAIRDRSYCFNKKDLSLEALAKLEDKKTLVKFWEELIGEKKTKVSVQVFGSGEDLDMAAPAGSTALFESNSNLLKSADASFYPNEHLCPDKVLLLDQMDFVKSITHVVQA